MSTSLLYRGFGIRRYEYVKTAYEGGRVLFTIAQKRGDLRCAVCGSRQGLAGYFRFYNTDRPHQALGYRTPAEVHFGTVGTRCNNVTGVNKKEKEAKRKKTLLLQNTTLKN